VVLKVAAIAAPAPFSSITRLRTIDWGWNSFPLGVGALPHDFPEPYVHYFRFDDARSTAESPDS
jgi:hypothetical protein